MRDDLTFSVPLERPRIAELLIKAGADVPSHAVLFTGLAGNGKSIASLQYLERLQRPCAVLELVPGEPQGWEVLASALEQLDLPLAAPEATLRALSTPAALLVDRFELALDASGRPSKEAEPWVASILTHPTLHVILVSEIFPVSPLIATIYSAGQLKLIDGRTLAFTAEEAAALWKLRQGQELPEQQARRLIEQTAGLAALVALACATGALPSETAGPIHDLLIDQILEDISPALRASLARLALLESFDQTMIDLLAGDVDGAELMRLLRQRGLLLREQPATLHPLVRQILRDELRSQPARYREIAERATSSLLAAGEHRQAWRLAREAQLWDIGRTIIGALGQELREQGRSQELIELVEAIPPAERGAEAAVLLARAQADVGDYDGAILTLSALIAQEHDPRKRIEQTIWLANMRRARGEHRAADELIQPFLADQGLPALWQARVYRIHATTLAWEGQASEALAFAERALATAQSSGDARTVAIMYQEHGLMAGRMGRYAEAEHSLRLASRSWKKLNNAPELALTLNAQAMLALTRRQYKLARKLALEARLHGLHSGRLREAMVASATSGDVAIAEGSYKEALMFYEIAADDAERIAEFAHLIYSLALQGLIAWITRNTTLASQLQVQLAARAPASAEERCWLAASNAALALALGQPPDMAQLQQALRHIGQHSEVRMVVQIILAQSYWLRDEREAALETWREVEQALSSAEATPAWLIPIATALPALVEAALQRGQSSFTRSVIAEHPSLLQASEQAPGEQEQLLVVRLLGGEQIFWHGQPVKLPKNGVDLLALLLLATPYAVEEEELLRRIWGDKAVSIYALRKLVTRIGKDMPRLIKRPDLTYKIGLSRDQISFDLLLLLRGDLAALDHEELVGLVEAAQSGYLTRHDAPWAIALRPELSRRLALAWLELGRRASARGLAAEASNAFENAQQADPASDLVTRLAMTHALSIGDRTLALQRYQRYKQALDEQLGVDPAKEVERLYRQALEP